MAKRHLLMSATAFAATILLAAAAPGPVGYLATGAFDVTKVLPPAPTIGDPGRG